jgi:hypothetical protein
MRWLFRGLVSLQQPLKELAIQNQQNVSPLNRGIIARIDQIFQKLTSLRLNIVHELDPAAPENEIEVSFMTPPRRGSSTHCKWQKRAPHEFFTRILPSIWLKPAMGSLQKLTLYSTFMWGCYPKANLDGVHFPQLKSLALGRFSFVDDKQLDWILAHSSTLQELYLDDCPIIVAVRMFDSESDLSNCQVPESEMVLKEAGGLREFRYSYPRRWHEYFSSIQEGLPKLRQFGFGLSAELDAWVLPFEKETEIVPALMQDRYLVFDGGVGPNQFNDRTHDFDFDSEEEWPDCDEEDRNALKKLYHKIGQQVDCGKIEVSSRRTVEDLLQV